jgi:hypothetical protein
MIDSIKNEAFKDSFKKTFDTSYQQAKQGAQEDYSQYADVAQKSLAKAGGAAQILSQKTGVPLPLATALVAAGITGGPTAIPFAALLYFVKQPLMKGANKAFDATWDAGAKVAGKVSQMMTPQPALQPEWIKPGSFRDFVEADTWGDWAGEKAGQVAGRVAGNMAGFGGKIASALGSRAKEIGDWAKGNPKEVARMLFLVGAGAAIGAGVGKVTHDVKDFILQKIKDQGIDPQVLSWAKQNIVLDGEGKSSSGETLTSKGGQEVEHPSFIDPKTGHKISLDQTVSTSGKYLKNIGGSNEVGPSDLHAQGTGVGNTVAVGSSGGTENLTRVSVPNSPDLRDTYRDAARVLQGEYKPGILGGIFGGDADRSDATNSMIQSSPTPLHARVDLKHYGHSAAEEIKKRLASAADKFSPDKYTTPAAVAGGIVGGTGNNRNK